VEDVVTATVTWADNATILECVSRPHSFLPPQQDTMILANRTMPSPSVPWIIDLLHSTPNIDNILVYDETCKLIEDKIIIGGFKTTLLKCGQLTA